MKRNSMMAAAACLFLISAQIAWGITLVNPSFENPVLAVGESDTDIYDWYDGMAYSSTIHEGDSTVPDTPYGANWAELGGTRWMYQQIGTFQENTTYQITFLAAKKSTKDWGTVYVELWAGGDPLLAVDIDIPRTVAAFPLAYTVGATQVAVSDPIVGITGTVEMSIELTTPAAGAGYSVGDPLWLLFARTVAGRSDIDNVAVTIITGDPAAVNPTPNNTAEFVDPMAAMTWEVINATGATFDINIGTNTDCNDVLVAHSTGSTQSYTPTGLLNYTTEYFWRVDTTDSAVEYPGTVWSFTTGGAAYDPIPASGGTANRLTGVLSWSGDALISSYDVWFGAPGNLQFVGNDTAASVSFDDLAVVIGQSPLPEGDYQWRIDTRDGASALMVTGDVWDVTIPPVIVGQAIIEDFDGYHDTADLLVNWTGSDADLSAHDLYGGMQIDYDTQASPYTAEATRVFSPEQNWSVSGTDTFALTYCGSAGNDPESLVCSISDGSVTATVLCPQSGATSQPGCTTWYIRLVDFTDQGLDLTTITSVTIGIGDGTAPGGTGTIYVDDLLIDLPGCIDAFQSVSDLNKDCQTDIDDVALLAGHWLLADFDVLAAVSAPTGLVARYNFEETSGTTASDSSPNSYDATVDPNLVTDYWNTSGVGGTRCLQISDDLQLLLPASVLAGVSDALTVCFWASEQCQQADFMGGLIPGTDELHNWDYLAWGAVDPQPHTGDWSHYAFVKDAVSGSLQVFYNGTLTAQRTGVTALLEGTNAGQTIIQLDKPGSAVRIDDLQVYSTALSQSDIIHLIEGGGGSVLQPIEPIYTAYDLDDNGRIDMAEFSVVASRWLEVN